MIIFNLKAQVMLEKSRKYEILPLGRENKKTLILYKSTETEDQFVVVAGYYREIENNDDERILAEIETVPVSEYEALKKDLRDKISVKKLRMVPITFW